MKRKGNKKIHLNRETLRTLESGQLKGVAGAVSTPTRCDPLSGCYSCGDTCPVRACGSAICP